MFRIPAAPRKAQSSSIGCRSRLAVSLAIPLFWTCVAVVCYAWFGYPLLLWVASRLSLGRRAMGYPSHSDALPSVTVIVAVHNEETALSEKIENILGTSYPRDRIEVIIASDGSTDKTVPIATGLADRYREVRLLDHTDRAGKTVVQNAAVKSSTGEIVVFSDVDTKFSGRFLESITAPFAEPRVGCVTGAVVWTNRDESAVVVGGDFYWRYEHFMWKLESQLGLLAWGSGACLAMRRELFRPMEPQ